MPFLYKDEINSDRNVKAASVSGWRMDTHFHFKVVELWPAGTSTYVFIAEASLPSQELFNRLCMWGGASKTTAFPGYDGQVPAWEFHESLMPVVASIVERTKAYRPADAVEFPEKYRVYQR